MVSNRHRSAGIKITNAFHTATLLGGTQLGEIKQATRVQLASKYTTFVLWLAKTCLSASARNKTSDLRCKITHACRMIKETAVRRMLTSVVSLMMHDSSFSNSNKELKLKFKTSTCLQNMQMCSKCCTRLKATRDLTTWLRCSHLTVDIPIIRVTW